tara:strand:- start:512 stop:973 length:462 start_codon:yes stop_codon:yes gene_type:complete
MDPSQMVEKYLEIDDFIEKILLEPDLFLIHLDAEPEGSGSEKSAEENSSGSEKDEEKMRLDKIVAYMIKFMQQVQDCINYEKVIQVCIKKDLHSYMMNKLFEETDDSIKMPAANQEIIGVSHPLFGGRQEVITKDKSIFGRINRLKMLTGLIN